MLVPRQAGATRGEAVAEFVQQLVNGLTLGSIYGLIAIGYTMVFGIIGKEDPATTPEMGELLAGSIPGAKAVKLDAAHLSNVEQPEAFTKAVVDFLKG